MKKQLCFLFITVIFVFEPWVLECMISASCFQPLFEVTAQENNMIGNIFVMIIWPVRMCAWSHQWFVIEWLPADCLHPSECALAEMLGNYRLRAGVLHKEKVKSVDYKSTEVSWREADSQSWFQDPLRQITLLMPRSNHLFISFIKTKLQGCKKTQGPAHFIMNASSVSCLWLLMLWILKNNYSLLKHNFAS